MKPETSAAALPPELLAGAEEQLGVLSRGQLAALGVERWNIRDQVRARRWRIIGRAAVLHRGPLTAQQRRWVCVLHAGPGALLAGRTALTSAGLQGWDDGAVHVVVRRGTHVPPLPGLVVHESRRLSPADVASPHRPPRVRVERAAVDAACWSHDPRTACGLLAAVVQQRLTTAARLRGALLRAGQVRHRRLMLAVLDDIEGGSQALSEIDFVRLCRRLRLPPPHRQALRRDRHGKVRYLDATWELPDGRTLVVEVDGAIHLLVGTYWEDMWRANEISLDGSVVLRYPSVAVRLADPRLLDQLARALGATCQRIRVS